MKSKQVTARMIVGMLLTAFCLPFFATGSQSAERGIPDQSFNYKAPNQKALLVLIGGNSECTGQGAIWLHKEKITEGIANATGLAPDELSKHYFSWTGEDPDTGSWRCIPKKAGYLFGQRYIVKKLDGEVSPDTALIIVAHSNGGATAAQVANLFYKKGHPVDLLVTFDPVSFLTRLPFRAPPKPHAKLWIDVYVSSDDKRLTRGDDVAFVGRAWNRFQGPTLITCMEGHHGDVPAMWKSVVLASSEFQHWGKEIHDRLNPASTIATYTSDTPFVPCKREPPGY
jgi:hypothetical protein